MLAQLAPEDVERLYPGQRLDRMTSRSLTSVTKLQRELEAVRDRGYATNVGESEDDVAAVAVAIPGRPGMRRAAITVSAPITRFGEHRVRQVARFVLSAAGVLRWSGDV